MSYTPGPGKNRPRYAGKVVCVRWDDASYCGSQEVLKDIDEGFVVDTYGVCVRESKKGLTVTMDAPHGLDQFRHSSFIPWGMVRAVKVYGTEWTVKRG